MQRETGRLLARPVFIIGVARSGTSMLYSLLLPAARLFSLRTEARGIWRLPELRRYHPAERGWASRVLTAEDVHPGVGAALERAYYVAAMPNHSVVRPYLERGGVDRAMFGPQFAQYVKQRSRAYRQASLPQIDESNPMEEALNAMKEALRPLRFLEKTPANCLRVGFLNALFPDALFVYLRRDGPSNVNSLMEGWKVVPAGGKRSDDGYEMPLPLRIPGVPHGEWRFSLVPGWQDYVERPLEEVATAQWVESNRIALEALASVEAARVYSLRYEDLVDATEEQLRGVCRFIDVPFTEALRKLCEQPPVVNAITPPARDKWRRQNGAAIERMLPTMAAMRSRMGYKGEVVASSQAGQ